MWLGLDCLIGNNIGLKSDKLGFNFSFIKWYFFFIVNALQSLRLVYVKTEITMNKQKTSLKSYKVENKIHTNPGLT